jgi:hypothetical protein
MVRGAGCADRARTLGAGSPALMLSIGVLVIPMKCATREVVVVAAPKG